MERKEGCMRITTVIPAFNYAAFLERAVMSVAEQSLPSEIIVVDDGSTDHTADVAAELRCRLGDDHFRYVRQNNAGPSAARNHGWRLARGDWVAFLDADDYWYRYKLERQAALRQRFPLAGLLFSGVDIEDSVGRRRRSLPETRLYTWADLILQNPVQSPTPLVRASLFRDCGGFDENLRLAEDRQMWLRIAEKAPLAGLGEALATYFDHGAGLHKHARMFESSCQVIFESMARNRGKVAKGLADRALASLIGAEAWAALQEGDVARFQKKARQAIRLDRGRIPQMAWGAMYGALKEKLSA